MSLGHAALQQSLGPLTPEALSGPDVPFVLIGSEARGLECRTAKVSGICWAKLVMTQSSGGTYPESRPGDAQR